MKLGLTMALLTLWLTLERFLAADACRDKDVRNYTYSERVHSITSCGTVRISNVLVIDNCVLSTSQGKTFYSKCLVLYK